MMRLPVSGPMVNLGGGGGVVYLGGGVVHPGSLKVMGTLNVF